MEAMCSFFDRHIELPIPHGCNPLDFVLDVVNNNPQIAEIVASDQFAALFSGMDRVVVAKDIATKMGNALPLVKGATNRSEIAEVLEKKFRASGLYEQDQSSSDFADAAGLLPSKSSYASWGTRFLALLHREFLQKLRNPDVASTELAFGVMVSLIFGTIYLRFPIEDVYVRSMAANWGTLLMGLIVFHVCIIFPAERPIWRRDYVNGLYGSLEFYMATVMAGLPGDIAGSFVFALIFYLLTTVQITASGIWTYMGFHVLATCTFAALYYIAGAIAPTGTVANAITSVLLVFIISLNGYFIPLSSIGWWWRWISEINFLRFVNDAVLVTQFGGQVFNCTNTTQCLYPSGDAFLASLSIDPNLNVGLMGLYTIICFLIFHVFGFLCVHFLYKI